MINDLNKKQNLKSTVVKQINYYIDELIKINMNIEPKVEIETYKIVPYLMKTKFVILLKSIALLEFNEMRQSTGIIVRSLFEILVDFLYCETNKEELYTRFKSFSNVTKVKYYNLIEGKRVDGINQKDFNNKTLPAYNAFKSKYNITNDNQLKWWCGITLNKRIEIIKLKFPEIEEMYKLVYKLRCDDIHLDSNQLISHNFKVDNNMWIINYNDKSFWNLPYEIVQEINSVAGLFLYVFKKEYLLTD